MSIITKEVRVCDVCGKDVGNFYYWETLTCPFGVRSKDYLCIDICEGCAEKVRYGIPPIMFTKKSIDEIEAIDIMKIEETLDKWRSL